MASLFLLYQKEGYTRPSTLGRRRALFGTAMALRIGRGTYGILLFVPLPGITATDPCVLHGEANRDPHLHFAHGGRADFRGEEGKLYSFLSAPGLAVNVKTENAVFRMNNNQLVVHGSFITEAHVVARSEGSKSAFVNASFWARELTSPGEDNWGWQAITGFCGRQPFKFGRRGSKNCFGLAIRMRYFSATFAKGGWTIHVRGNHVYDRVAGPMHRLDISFSAARGEARSLPHGIIGQSFSSSAPRQGLVDEYPAEGHFTTHAMAEGAIEGEASMYELPFAYAVDFAFSRFNVEWLAPILADSGTDASPRLPGNRSSGTSDYFARQASGGTAIALRTSATRGRQRQRTRCEGVLWRCLLRSHALLRPAADNWIRQLRESPPPPVCLVDPPRTILATKVVRET